jgi:hypothetical protein
MTRLHLTLLVSTNLQDRRKEAKEAHAVSLTMGMMLWAGERHDLP